MRPSSKATSYVDLSSWCRLFVVQCWSQLSQLLVEEKIYLEKATLIVHYHSCATLLIYIITARQRDSIALRILLFCLSKPHGRGVYPLRAIVCFHGCICDIILNKPQTNKKFSISIGFIYQTISIASME